MTYQRNETPEPMAGNDTCPECGAILQKGDMGHRIEPTLMTRGFWLCPKFYGPDGRRIDPNGGIVKSFADIL